MAGPMIRVKDASGNLFNFTAGEASRYVRANPGSMIVTPPAELERLRVLPEPRQDRPADEALLEKIAELEAKIAGFPGAPAAAASNEEAPDFDAMNVVELKAYAKENGIALEGATLKPDILEAVKAGHAAAHAPAEAPAVEDSAITTAGAAGGSVTLTGEEDKAGAAGASE